MLFIILFIILNNYLKKSDFKAAEEFAKKSLEYNKLMLPSYFVLGEIYSQQKDIEKTEQIFRLALERGLENETLHFEWGKACVRFFDYDTAKIHFLKSLEFDSEYTDSKIGLALINSYYGDFTLLGELKEKFGKNVYIQEAIAIERYTENKFEDAIDMFKKALRTDSKQTYNYINLARAYKNLNNKIKVRENYEKFIQENLPRFYQNREGLQNLRDFAACIPALCCGSSVGSTERKLKLLKFRRKEWILLPILQKQN